MSDSDDVITSFDDPSLDGVDDMKTYKDSQLTYAAEKRCPCGAGLAHFGGDYWDCSDILTGRAIPSGQPGSKQHTAELPFVFYEILPETQPSARGQTK